MQAATISEVTDPETEKVLGYEIISNVGNAYFIAADTFYRDIRLGSFPNNNVGIPFPRREIVRLEPQNGL